MIAHGIRKIKLFSNGPKSVHKVIRGYYLVLPNDDRYWIGESIFDAARDLNNLLDKHLTENNPEYWIDWCAGYDINHNLAWANIDKTDEVLAAAEKMGW